jgi:membrane fusion protein, multidrug efflux system
MSNTTEDIQQMEQPTLGEALAEVQVAADAFRKARTIRALWIGGAIVFALIVIVISARYIVWSAGHEETDDAYLQGHVHAVSSRVVGTVQQVLVDDNQLVKEGQTLVLLDPRDYQVKVDQAQAALDVALKEAQTAQQSIQSTAKTASAQRTEANGTIRESIANISAAKAGLLAAKAGVAKAEAELASAQATEHREELDLHRYEDLITKGQVSKQTVEHAREAYQVAVAGTAARQQAVSQSQAQAISAEQAIASAQAALERSQGMLQSADASKLEINVRDAQFSTAKASIGQASTALEDAKLQLSYTTIAAPVAGRVARKSVEAGQRLQSGQPLLAVVEDNPWIVANFKETQLENIRPNQPVDIRVDSFPHHDFHGHVDSLAPGSGNEFALLPPDNATGNFTKIVQRIPVKIVLDRNSMHGFETLLMPGTSAIVTVTTRSGR